MFVRMQEHIKEDFARYMFHVEAVREDERQQPLGCERSADRSRWRNRPRRHRRGRGRQDQAPPSDEGDVHIEQAITDKIPRNAPCPCGREEVQAVPRKAGGRRSLGLGLAV